MRSFRSAFAVLVVTLSLAAVNALAASYSTDQSDLWWTNPPGSENGWGIQLVQRGNTVFATMFVYGPNGAPTWYVATMVPVPPDGMSWTGDLYATTGPYFGTVPFNPANVMATLVGTMTWTPASVTTGSLSYTVNGTPVAKSLVRQTLVNEDYSGHFAGAIREVDTKCTSPSNNGTYESLGFVDINQAGTLIGVTTTPLSGPSCTYTGPLTQYGQMGDVPGSFTCTDGSGGAFEISELQVTELGLTGRFSATYTSAVFQRNGCHATGYFGGLRTKTI